ncbi:hypothetical protein [Streptomyces sp. SGAir0957]
MQTSEAVEAALMRQNAQWMRNYAQLASTRARAMHARATASYNRAQAMMVDTAQMLSTARAHRLQQTDIPGPHGTPRPAPGVGCDS